MFAKMAFLQEKGNRFLFERISELMMTKLLSNEDDVSLETRLWKLWLTTVNIEYVSNSF